MQCFYNSTQIFFPQNKSFINTYIYFYYSSTKSTIKPKNEDEEEDVKATTIAEESTKTLKASPIGSPGKQ